MTDAVDLLATLETLAARQGLYQTEGYLFVMESLEQVLTGLPKRRHISGGELLEGIKDHARERFGPMAKDVLNSWGVHTTLDFGHIVFHLVEAGLLQKTPNDSLSDFIDKFDFGQVFEAGYFENHKP